MNHEWTGQRVLSPLFNSVVCNNAPYGEVIGDNNLLKTTLFEVIIPDGVGSFDVTSTCGTFKGEMQIVSHGKERVLTYLHLSAPKDAECDEPAIVKGGEK